MHDDFGGASNTVFGMDACVVIKASDTVLDCDGHSLVGDGLGVGILLDGSLENVTIHDCDVSGYSTGLHASKADSSVVSDSVFGEVGAYAMELEGSENRLSNVTMGNVTFDLWLQGGLMLNSSSSLLEDPEGYIGTGKYVDIMNSSAAMIDISIHYNESYLEGDEENLALMRYSEDWGMASGYCLLDSDSLLCENINRFGVFGLFERR
jgi:hypothetical protein